MLGKCELYDETVTVQCPHCGKVYQEPISKGGKLKSSHCIECGNKVNKIDERK